MVEDYEPSTAEPQLTATADNFDVNTLRAIVSFTLELGARRFGDTPSTEHLVRDELVGCNSGNNESGSKAQSRMHIENQLAGTKAMMAYLSSQAMTPQMASDITGTPISRNAGAEDMALLGMRIQDGHGRGVQQTEMRWQEIGSDTGADVIVPAGLWEVDVDVGGAFGGIAGAPLSYELFIDFLRDNSTPSWPTVERYGFSGTVDAGTRERHTKRFKFEAGETYELHAYFDPTTTDTDLMANDEIIAKVKVIDCTDATAPNGINPHAFCSRGLPFPNSDFQCDGETGRCSECWVDGIDIADCGGGLSFCNFGMCDDPSQCWSGEIEDDVGQFSQWGYGLGTHTWIGTMHEEDASDLMVPVEDADRFRIAPDEFEGTILANSVYEMHVVLDNLCDMPPVNPDYPLDEASIAVFQYDPVEAAASVEITDGWIEPVPSLGITIPLSAEKVQAFVDGCYFLIRLKNPTLESFAYTLTATLEYSGLILGGDDPELIQGAVPVDMQDVVEINLEEGQIPKFEISSGAFEEENLLFFKPENYSPDVPVEIEMVVVDRHGRDPRGAVEMEGGLGVDLSGLLEHNGPYRLHLKSNGTRERGALYICPLAEPSCSTYEPRRHLCGRECSDENELCCLDETTGALDCRNIWNDDTNCGGCGVACEWDEVCLQGVCANGQGLSCWETTCPDGMWCVSDDFWGRTNPKCAALLVDNENCGWRGHVCPENRICGGGLCRLKRRLPCDAVCGESEQCCWILGVEFCVDTENDFFNCGSCANICALGQLCEAGQCEEWYDVWDPCPFETVNCGEGGDIECKNLMTDEDNCGGCRIGCGDGAWCEDGKCHELPYPGEFDEDPS
jgi:hypothetical protein